MVGHETTPLVVGHQRGRGGESLVGLPSTRFPARLYARMCADAQARHVSVEQWLHEVVEWFFADVTARRR